MNPPEAPNPHDPGARLPSTLYRAFPPALLTIIAVVLLLAAGGDAARALLRYERLEIVNGAWWRLITCHLVHLSWSHALLNLAGLVFVWWLFLPLFDRLLLGLTLLLGLAAISTGFLLVNDSLAWYVGLSGMLHALFAAGAVASLYARQSNAILFLAALVIKLVWEQVAGPIPLTEAGSGGAVIVDAHLWGALGGFVAAWIMRLRNKQLGYNHAPKERPVEQSEPDSKTRRPQDE